MQPGPHEKTALRLGIIFVIWGVIWSINPIDPKDWLIENVLSVLALVMLALTARRFPLSRVSYFLIFLFLCLHEVGSHYTYALVPYNEWSEAVLGRSINSIFGFERNHYDRLVHFSYGLLLAYPIRELFHRVADVKGFWGYFLPLDITMSTSMLYELIEWGAAEVFGGELGAAYLGTQGDVWDAHKDMGLASLGALIAMIITALINWRLQRDFMQEFLSSLRVKSRQPLGEDEIKRMIQEKRLGDEGAN